MTAQQYRQTAENMTNDKGREFLAYWVKQDITGIAVQEDSNWFYCTTSKNVAIALPHANNGTGPSFFGNNQYLIDVLENRQTWQRRDEPRKYVWLTAENTTTSKI